jgi:hypothetical protein
MVTPFALKDDVTLRNLWNDVTPKQDESRMRRSKQRFLYAPRGRSLAERHQIGQYPDAVGLLSQSFLMVRRRVSAVSNP